MLPPAGSPAVNPSTSFVSGFWCAHLQKQLKPDQKCCCSLLWTTLAALSVLSTAATTCYLCFTPQQRHKHTQFAPHFVARLAAPLPFCSLAMGRRGAMSSGIATQSSGMSLPACWSQRLSWWQPSSWLSSTTPGKSFTLRPGGGFSSLLVSLCRQHFAWPFVSLKSCWHELSTGMPPQGAAQRVRLPGPTSGILSSKHALSSCHEPQPAPVQHAAASCQPAWGLPVQPWLALQCMHSTQLHCSWASVTQSHMRVCV